MPFRRPQPAASHAPPLAAGAPASRPVPRHGSLPGTTARDGGRAVPARRSICRRPRTAAPTTKRGRPPVETGAQPCATSSSGQCQAWAASRARPAFRLGASESSVRAERTRAWRAARGRRAWPPLAPGRWVARGPSSTITCALVPLMPKGGDAGAADPLAADPGASSRKREKPLPASRCAAWLVGVKGPRQGAVLQNQHHLDDTDDAGRCLGMPQVGLPAEPR